MDEQGDARHSDDQINLGKIIGRNHKYALTVNNETPEDASVRHKNEMAEAELKRKMVYALFCFALFVVGTIFIGCIYVFAMGTIDDRKWATGIISAIASGLIGFLVGQGKK
ncbi:MAG TPA: hypothetical protein PKL83_04480 [bacterium]|nr:hypothetical protein [bacterium]